MINYTKHTQRSQALDSQYFTDCQTHDDVLSVLRVRGSKSLRQHKKDCRLAHAIEKRQRAAKRTTYAARHATTDNWMLANSALDNRTFTVCQLSNLDFTPRHRDSLTGEQVFTLKEKYAKDRAELDKFQRKRSKN